MTIKNEWPMDSTKTKLSWLEKPVTSDEVPKSRPAPELGPQTKAVEAEFNARTAAIHRRPA